MTNNKEVNPGWKQQDQHYRSIEADPSNDPDIQILTEEDWEDDNLEQWQY